MCSVPGLRVTGLGLVTGIGRWRGVIGGHSLSFIPTYVGTSFVVIQ